MPVADDSRPPLFLLLVLLLNCADAAAAPAHAAATPSPRAPPLSAIAATSTSASSAPTPSPNHIDPHDRMCRDYLKSFLKGTTDARDECRGLLNAYDAADCSAEEGDGRGGRGERRDPWRRWWHDLLGDDDYAPAGDDDAATDDGDSNSTATDDDDAVDMIDDYYENSACCDTIHSYYLVHCHDDQSLSSAALLGIVGSLIVCGLVRSLLRTFGIGWLPEAAGCILVGAAAGLLAKIFHPELMDVGRMPFDDDLFLSILLPPIIFQATLAIDKPALCRNLLPVGLFAVVGTALSALMTGGIVYGLTRLLPGTYATPIPLLDSMIFGSLISSVDPVATLSVLSSFGVAEADTLYVLVFGESLLNDGVAIVLFRTLIDHLDGGGSGGTSDGGGPSIVIEVARKFSVVTAGSALVGLTCGVACCLYFRTLRGCHPPVVEVAIFFCWALVSYYLADVLGLSGIIAIMTAGFFVDVFVIGHRSGYPPAGGADGGVVDDEGREQHLALLGGNDQTTTVLPSAALPPDVVGSMDTSSGYGYLSAKSRYHIGFVAEVISSITETAIFAYLGLFLFADGQSQHNTLLSFVSVSSCVVSRVVMVGLLSFVINAAHAAYDRCGRCCSHSTEANHPAPLPPPGAKFIDRRMQLILLFSGIRGAVSLALVENIPLYNAVTKQGSKYKAELKAMASSSIIFTVFVFGASTYFLLQRGETGDRASCGDMRRPTTPVVQNETSLSDPLIESGGNGVEEDEHTCNGLS